MQDLNDLKCVCVFVFVSYPSQKRASEHERRLAGLFLSSVFSRTFAHSIHSIHAWHIYMRILTYDATLIGSAMCVRKCACGGGGGDDQKSCSDVWSIGRQPYKRAHTRKQARHEPKIRNISVIAKI